MPGVRPARSTYDLAIDSKGHVTGEVGDLYVTFDVADPA